MKLNNLIKKVQEFKIKREDYLFGEIVEAFRQCINNQLKNIDDFYKEDLSQEILIAIYNAILKFKINEIDINEVIQSKQFLEFKEEYVKGIDDLNILLYEYQLFINENQFKKYIKTLCRNETKTFYRKNIKDQEKNMSLNSIKDEVEMIELVCQSKYKKNETILDKMNKKELDFVYSFYNHGEILKKKDVAKMKNVTPQAISMSIKRLKEKYYKK